MTVADAVRDLGRPASYQARAVNVSPQGGRPPRGGLQPPPGLGDGIRLAGPGDAEAVASLLTQHGYPHDRSQASDRLLAWAAESLASVLVADLDGSVAGLAAVHRQPHFERPGARPRVVALIVDADRGPAEIRRRLMDAVGRWAAARGCSEVEAAPPGLAGT